MSAAGGDDAAQRFVADLVRVRQDAGMPSYATLVRLSEHRLTRSTMSDVLTGKRVRLPEWRFVAAFVAACREAAADSGLDPEELGTPAAWKRRWDAAMAGYSDVAYPGGRGVRRPRRAEGTPPDDAPADPDPAPGPGAESDPVIPPAGGPATGPRERTARPVPATTRRWGPVPAPAHDFVGREEALDELHDRLGGAESSGAVAVQGLGGIGKTQLAIAYADRFRHEYDLIWWVTAETREQADAGMAQLGIAGDPGMPARERAAAVVGALGRGRPYARWLLIFDNADAPEQIKDLLPADPGDIVITTRDRRWHAYTELQELDVLPRRDSVEFLLRRIRGISEVDAHRLAEAAGDLPLVLEHAAESRIPLDEYLDLLVHAPRRLLSGSQPSGYPLPVTESWDAAIERLRPAAPAALDLLRCCAFFGTAPIPLEALERGRFLPHSSLYATVADPILRSRAIGALGRTGLARIDSARRTIQVHRLVQGVVRDRLTEADADRSRHDVHLLLAAADPGDPDDFDNWPRYEELRAHLAPSMAEGCRDLSVRRLVLNMARYLRVVGDPVQARALADRALGRWADADGPGARDGGAEADDPAALAVRLAIKRCKADALRTIGDHATAFALVRAALADARDTLGDDHEETVILGRSLGAELRMRGLFAQALGADEHSAAAHRETFGRDHPQSFIAAGNLAVDHVLNGRYEAALRQDEDVYRDCLTFYGRADHPAVLFYRNAMARSMRLTGRYQAAFDAATEVGDGYRSVIDRGILGPDHPWVLANAGDLAAAGRDAGVANADRQAADVHNRCWRIFGVDHPQTLAAAVTLGTALGCAGRTDEALDVLTDAARRYRTTLGEEHPYAHACATGVAAARRQADDPATAITLLDTVLRGLRHSAGPDHPYTLDALVTRANVLADLGDMEGAEAAGRQALAGLRRVLGPDHPHTLACAGNLTLVLSALGRQADTVALRADLLVRFQATLGASHPATEGFLSRRRVDVVFSPVPL